ncbi:hypothetical protein QBC32DRAFT_356167 [Pseudoneurospora amorphoporcata]|uniref:Ankyrin repeat protein n=1 Tax=Pseudoneurospora amorphoporcata TaxID=241081 RepID=A0AAN6NNK6_9PEZI|nr:hypothetical protein QBC32DRAFT_356167 [Pseudoneurospora amorphoporcata]
MEPSHTKRRRIKQFFRLPRARQSSPSSHLSQRESGLRSPLRRFSTFEKEAQEEKEKRTWIGRNLRKAIQRHEGWENGSDPNAIVELYIGNESLDPRDQKGRTPLHVAAELGKVDLLGLFLERHNVKLDTVDFGKQTALHLATINDHVECVRQLLQAGADAELLDRNGHLPRFYSRSGEMRKLYDNPPKAVTASNSPFQSLHLRSQSALALSRPETLDGPRRSVCEYFKASIWEPNSLSNSMWRLVSVWDLIYEPKDDLCKLGDDKGDKSVKKRWIHLPIVSKDLVLDLVRSTYAASSRGSREFDEIERFVNAAFEEFKGSASDGKHHFKLKHQVTYKGDSTSDTQLCALVFPVIDVDKKDLVHYGRTSERRLAEGFDKPEADGLCLNELEKRHVHRMLQAANFMKQPLPRSLDQSYHEDLREDELNLLDNDQVILRFIRDMRKRCSNAVPQTAGAQRRDEVTDSTIPNQPAQAPSAEAEESQFQAAFIHRPTEIVIANSPNSRGSRELEEHGQNPVELPTSSKTLQTPIRTPKTGATYRPGMLPRANTATTISSTEAAEFKRLWEIAQAGPAAGVLPGVPKDQSSASQDVNQVQSQEPDLVRASLTTSQAEEKAQPHVPAETETDQESIQQAADDFLIVPNFWLFKLDADTTVTLYAERWDVNNEHKLHNHILKTVNDDPIINNPNDDASDDMAIVSEVIIKACMSFEAKAMVKCDDPDADSDVPVHLRYKMEPVTFTKSFSASIAQTYFQVTRRFDELKAVMGSLSKDPTKFYADTQRETAILIDVDDTIGEIGMIKRILLTQSNALTQFQGRGPGSFQLSGTANKSESLQRFEALEAEAERVRSMVTTLLKLRQREATLEDALSMGEQSTMLFVFTVVTVLFAPLSFVAGLLSLSIDGLPEKWTKSPLAEVFGLSALATTALCTILYILFKMYQTRNLAHARRHHHGHRVHNITSGSDLDDYESLKRCWWWERLGLGFAARYLGHPSPHHRARTIIDGKPAFQHSEYAMSGGLSLPGTEPDPSHNRSQTRKRVFGSHKGREGEHQGYGGLGSSSRFPVTGGQKTGGAGDGGTTPTGLRGGRRIRSGGGSFSSFSSSLMSLTWNRRARPGGGALGGKEDVEFGVIAAA